MGDLCLMQYMVENIVHEAAKLKNKSRGLLQSIRHYIPLSSVIYLVLIAYMNEK